MGETSKEESVIEIVGIEKPPQKAGRIPADDDNKLDLWGHCLSFRVFVTRCARAEIHITFKKRRTAGVMVAESKVGHIRKPTYQTRICEGPGYIPTAYLRCVDFLFVLTETETESGW